MATAVVLCDPCNHERHYLCDGGLFCSCRVCGLVEDQADDEYRT